MIITEYRTFIKKLANELRGKSSIEVQQRLDEIKRDVKREIAFGTSNKK
jgi:hypothetical protein